MRLAFLKIYETDFASRISFGAKLGLMYAFMSLSFVYDFVGFHILPQHIGGHSFDNLCGTTRMGLNRVLENSVHSGYSPVEFFLRILY